MFYNIKDFDDAFKGKRISKKFKQYISDSIAARLKVYKSFGKNPSNFSVVFCDLKNRGLCSITIIDKKIAPVECLEFSDEIISIIKKDKDGAILNSAYLINFDADYNSFEVFDFKAKDFLNLELKRCKTVIYGITDMRDVLPITINLIDVKGCEYNTLREAIKYKFSKVYERQVDTVNSILIEFIA